MYGFGSLFCLQTGEKILISKLFDQIPLSCKVPPEDGGQRHSVKGIGFDHSVQRHVLKYQALSRSKRLLEGIVADDVTRQTGWTAQTIGVWLFSGFSAV